MFFNRKKKTVKPPKDRSPHLVPPRVGVYPHHGETTASFPCLKCDVSIEVKNEDVMLTIEQHYTALIDGFDIFFPVSECGNLTEFGLWLNGVPMDGDLARDGGNGRLIAPGERGFEEEEEEEEQTVSGSSSTNNNNTADDKKKKEVKLSGASALASAALPPKKKVNFDDDDLDVVANKKRLRKEEDDKSRKERVGPPAAVYYYLVRGASRQYEKVAGPIKRGARLELKATIKTRGFWKESPAKMFNIPFALSNCSRSPDSLKYKIEMKENIRRVASANRSHSVFPYVNGKKADLSIDITPENRIKMTDYVFTMMVELGEPVNPQCADPISLLILVTCIGGFIFMTMTRDLEEF